jgi:hypothetical protein
MCGVMSVRKFVAALALTFAAAGCVGGGATSTPTPAFDGDLSKVLTITVRNQQRDEARAWLFIDSSRRRLGVVQASTDKTFHVPMMAIATVRMEFSLTLGTRCVTRDAPLGPGDDVDVTIPANLTMMAAVCSGI